MPEAEQSYLPKNNDAASRPRGWPAIALPGVVPKAASDRLASSDFHAKFARPLYARRAGRVLPHRHHRCRIDSNRCRYQTNN